MTKTPRKPRTRPTHIRWMIVRDLPGAAALDTGGTWNVPALQRFIRRHDCIGLVAERGDTIVGFVLYTIHTDALECVRLVGADAVTEMVLVAKLAYKVASHQRAKLHLAGAAAWATGTVRALLAAEAPAAILADAMEDAGCPLRWLLNDLRSPDGVLGKLLD